MIYIGKVKLLLFWCLLNKVVNIQHSVNNPQNISPKRRQFLTYALRLPSKLPYLIWSDPRTSQDVESRHSKFYDVPESDDRKSNKQSKGFPDFCHQGLNHVNPSLCLDQQVWRGVFNVNWVSLWFAWDKYLNWFPDLNLPILSSKYGSYTLCKSKERDIRWCLRLSAEWERFIIV